MTLQELDFIFPFVVFGYGLIVLMILHSKFFTKLAESRLPSEIWHQFQSRRILAWICFYVGGLWALQNIWFSA